MLLTLTGIIIINLPAYVTPLYVRILNTLIVDSWNDRKKSKINKNDTFDVWVEVRAIQHT